MKVFIRGRKSNPITLGNNDFVAKGGQGSIYSKNKTIFKIYTDSKDMIPPDKFNELSVLNHKSIIRPLSIVMNVNNKKIGYTMKEVDGEPLARAFTNDFWKRNNLTFNAISSLVEKMIEVISFIHNRKCLIVDGNELNYILDKNELTFPYFIDVDSYQTPSYSATVIMPSIRDYKTKGFNEDTDWFSFAVVSFQLFTGIHPFKGRHPKYKKRDIIQRVIDSVSVLNNDTSVPPSVRDFKMIPDNYYRWYLDLFEEGKRLPPPDKAGAVAIIASVKIHIIKGTDNFVIKEIKDFSFDLLHYSVPEGIMVAKTDNYNLYIGNKKYQASKGVEVLISPKSLTPIFVKVEYDMLKAMLPKTKEDITTNIAAEDMMITDNSLYIKFQDKFMEVIVKEVNNRIMLAPGTTFNVMSKSSKIFSGVVYQNVLGKPYLFIPTKKDSKNCCYNINIEELDDIKILDAKHSNGIVVVIGTDQNSGQYKKFIFRFSENYDRYDCRVIDEHNYIGINFVSLNKGIVVMVNSDDTIEVFFRRLDKKEIKSFTDKTVNSSVKLISDGNKVMFTIDSRIFSLSMK